ncbi:histidine kinase, partial [uncultured Actinomyces sp.]
DVVAHSLAVMITMADGAAAAVERNPAMAKEALGMLAETGRSALADTRRLVGVLRDDPGASSAPSQTQPQDPADDSRGASRPDGPDDAPAGPGTAAPTRTPEVRDLPVPEFAPPGTVAPIEPSEKIADLRRQATGRSADASRGDIPLAPAPEQADLTVLVSRFEAAGVPVTYTWNGTRLPEDKGLQLTLFRVAQEALTNVLRYAPTTHAVAVTVERHAGTAVLTIDNEAAPGSKPMHGSGKGLIGMRERAAVYGGTVQAGPTATGWRVRAVLRWDENDEGTSPWKLPL